MSRRLEPAASSAKDQVQNDDEQYQTEAAAAIVADSGAHVEATTAEKQQKNYQDENERHERDCSTGDAER